MLERLKLHNFRTFLNADLSGKTNLARAMRFLSSSSYLDLQNTAAIVPGYISELGNWHLNSDTIELSCTCTLHQDNEERLYTYDLALRITASLESPGQLMLRVARERLCLDAPGFDNAILLDNNGIEAKMLHEENHLKKQPFAAKTLAPKDATMLCKLYEMDSNRRAIAFRRYLGTWIPYSLNPESMRFGWGNKTAQTNWLYPSGENLSQVVYQMKNQDEIRYRKLLEHVRLIEPALEAINFSPTPGQSPFPFVVLKDRTEASWSGLSDGTLRLIAFAWIIESSGGLTSRTSSPSLVVIEEPENGIAPAVLRQFFDLFEERAPRTQFIFTSHSPYFIDLFDGDRKSVTVFRKTGDRTEYSSPPPNEQPAAERLTLSEEYAAELIG
jgi:predicted ATPase